ncbi:MAG: glycosyltransferase [Roseiarcus sp.]
MLKRSVLIVSPTPPIPRDYGNRNRVYQTVTFFKSRGFDVSFMLYPSDEDWGRNIPPYYTELVDLFEYFTVIPNSRRMHQKAQGFHHTIDEWWDPNIGSQLEWLFNRKFFDILFVNYTFFSAAFELAPRGCLKVLDTHDIFTGRRELFESNSVGPEFFYTSAAQESIAFNRADCIIAIKQSETDFIRTLTRKTVVTIPYWDDEASKAAHEDRALPNGFDHDRPLTLGFIGAFNSVNTVNMSRFLKRFDRYFRLYDLPVRIIVAGNVCKALPDYPFLSKLGRVPKIEDFYDRVDMIVTPLEFSTGIKIKVGEALARRFPVLATSNAFDGFRVFHPSQSEKSVASLCDTIADIATNDLSPRELVAASKRSALAAERAQRNGFEALAGWLKANNRRIVFITDRPFWYRGTFADEQIAQAIEYLCQIERVVVICKSREALVGDRVHCEFDYVSLGDSDIRTIIEEVAVQFDISAFILAETSVKLAAAGFDKVARHVWMLKFVESHGQGSGKASALIDTAPRNDRKPIVLSPVRYLPLSSVRTLHAKQVALFAPEKIGEWEEIVIDAAKRLIAARGLTIRVVRVPEYYEFEPRFFNAVIDEGASRCLLVEPHGWERVVMQVQRERGGASMIIREGHTVPEVLSDAGKPSLWGSIEAFLASGGSANVVANANTGWDRIWDALSSSRAKP